MGEIVVDHTLAWTDEDGKEVVGDARTTRVTAEKLAAEGNTKEPERNYRAVKVEGDEETTSAARSLLG